MFWVKIKEKVKLGMIKENYDSLRKSIYLIFIVFMSGKGT